MLISKIILLIVIWYTFFKGIFYLIASKDRINFGKHTRFENLELTEVEYTYRNKTASKLYLSCGLVIGLFLTMTCFLYDFFPTTAHIVLGFILILDFLFEEGILKTMIDFRLNEDKKK